MRRSMNPCAIPLSLLIAACASAQPVTPAPSLEGMPVIQVRHADGTTKTDLRPVDAATSEKESDGVVTTRTFRDAAHALTVRLREKTFSGYPATEQWVEVENGEPGAVVLERVESSAPSLRSPAGVWVKRFHGSWGNELNPAEEKVVKTVSIGSTRGTRVSEFTPQFFFLSAGGPAKEDSGEVLAGALEWNSNFLFDITPGDGGVTAHCGIHPAGSRYTLEAGRTFTAPRMLWMRSTSGMGDLSRAMHRLVRSKLLRDGDTPRSVLLNNWEATQFNFDERKIVSLFDGAQTTGFDLFLLDDGWFGVKHRRTYDTAGLGDWVEDPKKLPHGVSYLCDEAKKRGLRFGIWIEPEMVNPKSELYEKHPDWVIRFADKPLQLVRNQLVLDLTRPETRDYAFKVVDDLLTRNPGISYLKWDCNSHIPQPGSAWLAADRQENLFVDYANTLEDMMARIAARHPGVEMMLCGGGGGRIDLGSLRHFHEFWPSDNTDPMRRVSMQWEYSTLYPAMSICAHVTHSGNRPLKFAFDVAMSARLGADLDLSRLSKADLALTAQAVATYKREIAPVVHLGDQYRLESPHAGPRAAMDFVSPDKSAAVLFVYQLKDAQPGTKPAAVRPQGLDPAATYRVRELNLVPGTASALAADGKEIRGDALMRDGIVPTCGAAASSLVVKFDKAK